MARQGTPPPPTPAHPEEDPHHRDGLSTRRRDYRIRTNHTCFRVEHRRWWIFWEVLTEAPSYEWASRWIREQIRRAEVKRARWVTLDDYWVGSLLPPRPPRRARGQGDDPCA